ncbi:MAG: WecB/TagA/CpsF family glycosyltransferase [Candidatus Pacearchaeota archaeon]
MKFVISSENPLDGLDGKKVLNFINLNTIWWLKNDDFYRGLMFGDQNLNFPDGRILAFFSGFKQKRGPTFTKEFLLSEKARERKHFFIGLENEDLRKLSEVVKIPPKKLSSYNPPYIKNLEFSPEERKKIISLIRKFRPDFAWVCVGSPKQEILANQLFNEYKIVYFNVGAATDFLLGKKKEAPAVFRKLGLEWFYRFVTDFKYSKKKVWRSFIGLFYLVAGNVNLKQIR